MFRFFVAKIMQIIIILYRKTFQYRNFTYLVQKEKWNTGMLYIKRLFTNFIFNLWSLPIRMLCGFMEFCSPHIFWGTILTALVVAILTAIIYFDVAWVLLILYGLILLIYNIGYTAKEYNKIEQAYVEYKQREQYKRYRTRQNTGSQNQKTGQEHTNRENNSNQKTQTAAETSEYNIFKDCKTQEDAKAIYNHWVRQFHPDNQGGNEELMKMLNAQYDAFCKAHP